VRLTGACAPPLFMKEVKVVIGAGFGDEGKGLMTDYLASKMNYGIVVRFNGGAQAAHTVVTPDGRRHAFGHFGSGTFLGFPTYLSRFFVVNPPLFAKEAASLNKSGVTPVVYVDRACLVTTPYDMMLNQIAEITRGSSRHGSCGVGFNETITRSLVDDPAPGLFSLTVGDIGDEDLLAYKLRLIKEEYVPLRLAQLGITSVPDVYVDLLANDSVIDRFIEDVSTLLGAVTVADSRLLLSFSSVLFEGAQGLLLDQSHKFFPHVTRSHTGMRNVAELLVETGLNECPVEIVYVTRTYMTRHGAGPFPTELPDKPYPGIEDLTNVPNLYQGALRYGLLDLDFLAKTVRGDLRFADGLDYETRLAITCLDQVDHKACYIVNSEQTSSPVCDFVERALDVVGIRAGYISFGPTRSTITVF